MPLAAFSDTGIQSLLMPSSAAFLVGRKDSSRQCTNTINHPPLNVGRFGLKKTHETLGWRTWKATVRQF
jgi:hypothetical protein